MDQSTIESMRKHGSKGRHSQMEPRVTTSLTFESGNQVYLWVTDRSGCRLARK
jgi:hypothetical protein